MSLKDNVIKGKNTTFGGTLMAVLCFAAWYLDRNPYYWTGVAMGGGLIVCPDQIVPIFVTALKTLADAVIGRLAGLVGRKK